MPIHSLVRAQLKIWQATGWQEQVGRPPKATDPNLPGRGGRPCRPKSAALLRDDSRLPRCPPSSPTASRTSSATCATASRRGSHRRGTQGDARSTDGSQPRQRRPAPLHRARLGPVAEGSGDDQLDPEPSPVQVSGPRGPQEHLSQKLSQQVLAPTGTDGYTHAVQEVSRLSSVVEQRFRKP